MSTRPRPEEPRKTTIREFICDLRPKAWLSSGSDDPLLDEWFRWPPDIFALTSLLLSYTGAYRTSVSPPSGKWPKGEWDREAKRLAAEWRRSILRDEGLPAGLEDLKVQLQELMDEIRVDDLYDSNHRVGAPGDPPPDEDSPTAWGLCRVLLELHAISDEAMSGVGRIFSPHSNLLQTRAELAHAATGASEKSYAFFHLQANFLLTLRGSLSRIPKYRGIVLPKTRTPQVGLSLRSLSLYLTFHQTEVDVAWRAFPMFNVDENVLNMLVVPWPYRVNATDFRALPHPRTLDEIGPYRYFHYSPQHAQPLDVGELVDRIRAAVASQVRRIHLVVFPEMALTRDEFEDLKRSLERLPLDQIPMIIAGVSAEFADRPTPEHERLDKTAEHRQADRGAAGYNRIVLSVYFAGRWFDVLQDKHHRWLLDKRQILQYNLGGSLSGGRNWWEAIHIPRRRLSILAATSWLTICPLICEDLARLEPVSDLIRGIGPTFVPTLLMDGPQIRRRWAARYASVLADDPGSSVLALTSLGMARRSRRAHRRDAGPPAEDDSASHYVALWKDSVSGWAELPARDANGECPALVLSVAAEWTRELSADGRSESQNSAILAYQGSDRPWSCAPVESPSPESPGGRIDELTRETGVGALEPSARSVRGQRPRTRARDAKEQRVKILDMCELTLFTYFIDALLDTEVDPDHLEPWFWRAVRLESGQAADASPLTGNLVTLCAESIEYRDGVPDQIPTPHMVYAVQRACRIVRKLRRSLRAELAPIDMWEHYLEVGRNEIRGLRRFLEASLDRGSAPRAELEAMQRARDEAESKRRAILGAAGSDLPLEEVPRLHLGIALSILWGVHARLTTKRKFGRLKAKEGALMARIEQILSPRESDSEADCHALFLRWRDEERPLAPASS